MREGLVAQRNVLEPVFGAVADKYGADRDDVEVPIPRRRACWHTADVGDIGAAALLGLFLATLGAAMIARLRGRRGGTCDDRTTRGTPLWKLMHCFPRLVATRLSSNV
jgi:hypothetical protein